MKYYLRGIVLLVLLASFNRSLAQNKKNVVLFLVDDLGWSDVGAYGSSFYETPNIDQLATESIKFMNAYAAAPVCSPSRASLMTGKYPAAMRTTDWFGAPQPENARKLKFFASKALLPAPYTEFLPLEEKTIAEAFKAAGYKTMIAGKWHLGEDPKYYPENQGFDVNKGGYLKGHPDSYFSPYNNPKLTDGSPGEYLGDRLEKEATSFIEANKQQPFFMYFPFYEVHTPLQAKDSLIKKYRAKRARLGLNDALEKNGNLTFRNNQSLPVYAAMVETMDAIVGNVLRKIREAGLEENTIVIFTSDNGGLSTAEGSPTSNAPLRAGKGWLYEGGIRVPLLIKSRGQVNAGIVNNTLSITNDIYPTLLSMCDLPLLPRQHTGGVDLSPLFKGGALRRNTLYWHYPHYGNQGGFPGSAVRMGKWKLIENFEANKIELYNLEADISEKNDLSGQEKAITRKMLKKLREWRTKNHALMPIPNK